MAAVAPGSRRLIGGERVLAGTQWHYANHLVCAFTNVNGTTPDTWSTRQTVAGTNAGRGFRILQAAWESTVASDDEGTVTVSTTAATTTVPAFDTVTFDATADTDMDGDLHVWTVPA